ncbi:uncharacterized protein LOC120739399 [Simochromis diagramma]|uniref:uncharacterized protein LOC120739399 n=1 Tax=Simochromis diagramma TaxID=43689 RepID=UPI001A7ED1AF|nr:uncharacterized protein LOC120739399 [Simochromis diagramma]
MADGPSMTPTGHRGYKPLKEQLEQLKRAIRLASSGSSKLAEKECKAMEAELGKLIASQQRGLDDKIALSLVLKIEGERCEQQLEQLQTETEKRSINWRINQQIKELQQTHANCCKWMFLWNGASSWMEEDDTAETEDMESIVEALKQLKKQNKKLEDQMKNWIPKPGDANKYHTAEILPWATLTSNAIGRQHVMPVMTLRGGQVHGPDGQTAMVVGGVADVEYTRVPLVFHNEGPMTVKCQPLSGGGKEIAAAADEGLTSSSSSHERGDRPEAEASRESLPDQTGEVDRTPKNKEMISPVERMAQPAFIELPTPVREEQAQTSRSKHSKAMAKSDTWAGEVFGRMLEDPQGLLEVLNTLKTVKDKMTKGTAEEESDNDSSTSEEEDDDEDNDRGGVPSEPSIARNLRSRQIVARVPALMTDGPPMHQARTNPQGIGEPVDRTEGVVVQRGEYKELVTRGISAVCLGMSVGGVEQRVIGAEIAQNVVRTIKEEATNPRHAELREQEMALGEHIRPQTRVQHQPRSIQWLTGGRTTPSAADCTAASLVVLNRLAECGFKVSKDKLQLVRPEVTFLGRVIAHKSVGLMNTHRDQILTHPKPRTVREMLSFLGLTGYSRQFIPDYAGKTAPLRGLMKQVGVRNLKAELPWTPEAEAAFIRVKQDLSRASDLATPNYDEPFYLDVSETNSIVNGVLFQKKGGGREVLMYVSVKLHPTEAKHPTCTQHAAGVARIIQKTAHVVREHPLKILTTHSIVAYVNSQAFCMSPRAQQRLSKVLEAPNLTFTHEGINMADLMGVGEPHDCAKRAQIEEKIREDLKVEPIPGAEDWFTDGCCHRDKGGLKAGYAVVCRVEGDYQVRESGRIEGKQSAQRAEVIALARALRLAKNRRVNIYTDSAYAFGAAHVELPQWKRAGFRTATNAPISHKHEMEELEKALADPEEVSIIKCKAHSQGTSMVEKGNQRADEAAKEAAGYKGRRQMIQVTSEEEISVDLIEEVKQAQEEASPEEKGVWKNKGAWQDGHLWRGPDGRPVLTAIMAEQKVDEAHGLAHVGIAQMERNLCHWWHPELRGMIREKARMCLICGAHNPKPAVKPEVGFTPYELQTGRQFPAPWTVGSVERHKKGNRSHADYWNELKALVSSFTKQAACKGPTGEGEVPDAKAVWLRVIKRKWKEPRWIGPYEVSARTATAVQLKGKGDTWYHWTQCAAAHEGLVGKDQSPPNTGEIQRQNKPSHLCNGPTGGLPGRSKKEEQPRRRSPRQRKGAVPH